MMTFTFHSDPFETITPDDINSVFIGNNRMYTTVYLRNRSAIAVKCCVIYTCFLLRKKGYINFVPKSVRHLSSFL